MTVSPETIEFTHISGGPETTARLVITNGTAGPVEVASISVSGAAPVSVRHECGEIRPYEACQATVVTRAAQPGTYAGTIIVLQGGGGGLVSIPVTLEVEGRESGQLPFQSSSSALVALPGELEVKGRVGSTATSRVLLANTTGKEIPDLDVSVAGDAVFGAELACESVAPSGLCNLDVSFTPKADGAAGGYVIVTHSGGVERLAISVKASAEASAGVDEESVTVMATPEQLELDPANGRNNGRVILTNMSRDPVTVAGLSVAGSSRFELNHDCKTIAPGRTCRIDVGGAAPSPVDTNGLLVVSTDSGELVTVPVRQLAWQGATASPTGGPAFDVKSIVGSRATIQVSGELIRVKDGDSIMIGGGKYIVKIDASAKGGASVELAPQPGRGRSGAAFPDTVVPFPRS